MIRDDAASARVWLDPVDGALAVGAVGVECSTVSPHHARALHAQAVERGIAFVDAPLAGSRPQAEARALIFRAGGAEADVVRAEPVLRAMEAAVHRAEGEADGQRDARHATGGAGRTDRPCPRTGRRSGVGGGDAGGKPGGDARAPLRASLSHRAGGEGPFPGVAHGARPAGDGGGKRCLRGTLAEGQGGDNTTGVVLRYL